MHTSQRPNLRIRAASAADKDFIISLVPRLAEFGPPPWRDAAQMNAVDAEVLAGRLDQRPPGTAVFVAEDEAGVRLGFIHLQTDTDYYTREEHGHVGDIVVTPEGEGRGVGRALLEKGEEWARAQGFRWLALHVFAQNRRAREVYRRLGYGEDMLKCVKPLD